MARQKQTGFSLIEVMLALFVFLMMSLMFGMAVPMAVRAGQMSGQYTQATQIAMHKIDQLRAAGYSALSCNDLKARGIIDASNSAPGATNSAHSYTFTQVDGLVDNGSQRGIFPTGATGTITIAPHSPAPIDLAPTPGATFLPGKVVVRVTVTLNWTSVSGQPRTFSTDTLLIKMSHQ